MLKLIRIDKVQEKSGIDANSSLYANIANETFPPPIKIGPRASAWIESEIDTVIAARVRGWSDDQMRVLVRELVAKRQEVVVGGEAA